MKFRTLKAEEIECRVAILKDKWCTLLLYKDARADMNLLDEVVGPMGWKREHSRDNANCTVSIWNDDIKQWITKEDTGTESYTEKEKGLASDSFKRSCFNWGIGRELYSKACKFIYVPLESGETYKDTNGKTKLDAKLKFHVSEIDYDDNREIKKLVIKDNNFIKRFEYKPKKQVPTKKEQKDLDKVSDKFISKTKVDEINNLLKELGKNVNQDEFFSHFGIGSTEEMTEKDFVAGRNALLKRKEQIEKGKK